VSNERSDGSAAPAETFKAFETLETLEAFKALEPFKTFKALKSFQSAHLLVLSCVTPLNRHPGVLERLGNALPDGETSAR
jgi:hypothetical protein